MPHIHDLYDFTASALIIHKNRILLLHHKKLDTWLQPGGHIELNEDPEETLWREIKDETGLTKNHLTIIEPLVNRPRTSDSKQLPLPFDMNVFNYGDHPTHKHIDICYLLISDTDQIKVSSESNDIKWFTESELDKMQDLLYPNMYNRAKYVLRYVKENIHG